MKRGWGLVLAVVVIAIAQSPAHAEGHVVGAGTQSCSTWNKVRPETSPTISDTILYTSMENWMLGYVSLLSLATDAQPPSNDTMESYLDDYCSKHPLSHFYEGVQQLGEEWKKQGAISPAKPQ